MPVDTINWVLLFPHLPIVAPLRKELWLLAQPGFYTGGVLPHGDLSLVDLEGV